ncbi:hypothetical protein EF849_22090 [Aeromonas jandaei]|nr:hypothetical protein [Aeromonas jandaei]
MIKAGEGVFHDPDLDGILAGDGNGELRRATRDGRDQIEEWGSFTSSRRSCWASWRRDGGSG